MSTPNNANGVSPTHACSITKNKGWGLRPNASCTHTHTPGQRSSRGRFCVADLADGAHGRPKVLAMHQDLLPTSGDAHQAIPLLVNPQAHTQQGAGGGGRHFTGGQE
jgi:hypothetical protein